MVDLYQRMAGETGGGYYLKVCVFVLWFGILLSGILSPFT